MTSPAPALPLGPLVDHTPTRLPGRAAMRGRVVDLEPLDPASHGDSLFEATCGPGRDDLWLYLSKGPFEDRPSFDGYLRQLSSSADLSCFAIVDRRSRKAFGWAQFMRIEPAHRVIEVGNVVFSPSLRRTTGATEAVYMMARHAFDELGYRRLEWKCNALNAASRRAALRFGFRFEGVFRQHMISKGRSRDTAWFSIIDPEWPERKRSFELWLDPSNFDELGHQRTSLSSLNGAWTARGAPP